MIRTLVGCVVLAVVLLAAAVVGPDRPRTAEPASSARAAALEERPVAEVTAAPTPVSSASSARPTTEATAPAPSAVPTVATREGWEAFAGTGDVVGTDGPLLTYSVESEPGLDIDLAAWVRTVTSTLEDTERGWTSSGRRRFQRVDDDADLRVVLASPATVDAHCARAGLRTNGVFSCWVGDRAMLNAERWRLGSDAVPDLTAYRQYLVNHEVGHGLGFGHVGCPVRGGTAPVMMQQTKSTDGCTPNGWPGR